MKIVRNLENLFEKYIEGFFNNKFSSDLQPVEIAKELLKVMEDNKTIGVSKIYVPNYYLIALNNNDYMRLSSYAGSISEELADYITKKAREINYTFVGNITIELEKDDNIRLSKFHIISKFSEPIPDEQTSIITDNTKLSDTRLFTKITLDTIKEPEISASLSIINGPDKGLKTTVNLTRVNIGRRESNELPLTDINTSRLQAYIVYENNRHTLHDAKSLNGTYVNDRRIVQTILQTGDIIKVGNTVMLYEVEEHA